MRIAVGALVALIVLGVAAILVYDRLLSRLAQDFSILNAYHECLSAAHEHTGHYPAKFPDLGPCPAVLEHVDRPGVDAYGRELVYETRDDTYVLFTLGLDGRRDADVDPWELWREGKTRMTCRFNQDSITSDRGLLRACIL